ncbi:MAG: hypothetical protein ACI4O0_03675 [Candidatus Limivicinus sp.]
MKDFIFAALPWVLCGLAVAILCARLGRQDGSKSKKLDQTMATGAALGLLLGVTLNGCGLWENHALGLSLGPLWGMALASLLPDRNQSNDSSICDHNDNDGGDHL